MKSWKWIVGVPLLLAVCDDDDDSPDSDCYDFGNRGALCVKEPLPADAYCYAETGDSVQCHDQPP
ncbi:MAG: hypothetical protein FD150_2248 [Rhodobacteraceae bacterium]|nr:MAG: hypothetical protein FD150_2248 [Paracoccaceae bacterium]